MCTKLCACGIHFLTRMSKQLPVKDFCICTNKICQKSYNLKHGLYLNSLNSFNVPKAGAMISKLCVIYSAINWCNSAGWGGLVSDVHPPSCVHEGTKEAMGGVRPETTLKWLPKQTCLALSDGTGM